MGISSVIQLLILRIMQIKGNIKEYECGFDPQTFRDKSKRTANN